MAITTALQPGVATTLVQNQVYALPGRANIVTTSVGCDSSPDGSAWSAFTSGGTLVGGFIRCTTGTAIVTCAPINTVSSGGGGGSQVTLAVRQHNGGSSGGVTAQTFVVAFPQNTVAGSLLTMCTSVASSHQVTGVTDDAPGGSNVWVRGRNVIATYGATVVDIWYCINAKAGAKNVTVTYDANAAYNKNVFIHEVTGWQSCKVDVLQGQNQTSSVGLVASGPQLPTFAKVEFGVAMCSGAVAVNLNPQTGNEFNAGGDIAAGQAACSCITTAAGNHQPQWGLVGANDFASAVMWFFDVKAAAAVG